MRVCSYNASITMCETVLSVYNPIRGRDACVAGSGGGTRYARLPPVIEIIPRSGYLIRCMPKGAKKAKRHPCRSFTTGSFRSPCTGGIGLCP